MQAIVTPTLASGPVQPIPTVWRACAVQFFLCAVAIQLTCYKMVGKYPERAYLGQAKKSVFITIIFQV